MPFREIEQGIAALQAGNREEGARLLRIALKNDLVIGNVRAVALNWLAETNDERAFKVGCYNDALAADPTNEHARQSLATLLASSLPTPPAPSASAATPTPTHTPQYTTYSPPPPTYPQPPTVYTPIHHATGNTPTTPMPAMTAPNAHTSGVSQSLPTGTVVGVIGGPNGAGSAFFVTRDGLLATTRFVVGGKEYVTVELESGRQVSGRVVRSFAEVDLAFISIGHINVDLMPITSLAYVPDNQPIVTITYNGQAISGRQRPIKRLLAQHWFPTSLQNIPDAGGSPIFDERNYLIGMLTRNTSRSSNHVFGVHITAISRGLEIYINEMRSDPNRVYCPGCGSLSRAPSVRGFYCEVCGCVLPHARDVTRFPVAQADVLYGENNVMGCPHCGSHSGFYADKCLRCGGAVRI
jgi:S1-C subfamily serine protease